MSEELITKLIIEKSEKLITKLIIEKEALEAKVKTIQEHANHLGEIITNQTMKRLELEETVERVTQEIKRLQSELSKWQAPHEDADLQFMKEQSEQYSLSAQQAYINALEWRVKHLEVDLKLNTSMLAKQSDLAREAETERDRLSNAIGKHEKFIRSRNWVVSLEDEELYAHLKEVIEK